VHIKSISYAWKKAYHMMVTPGEAGTGPGLRVMVKRSLVLFVMLNFLNENRFCVTINYFKN
jgi:hypothetical protein